MKKCFECDAPAQADHHVVPKVLGGTKTIPLCDDCHSKVHDTDMLKMASLIRKQRRDAGPPIQGGKYWGGKRPYGFDVIDNILVENDKEQGVIKDIIEWRNYHMTIVAITDILNEKGIPTSTGLDTWNYYCVRHILKRYSSYADMGYDPFNLL